MYISLPTYTAGYGLLPNKAIQKSAPSRQKFIRYIVLS